MDNQETEERKKVGCGICMIIIFGLIYLGMILLEVYFLMEMVEGQSDMIYTIYEYLGYVCAIVGIIAAILVFLTLCFPYSKYTCLKSILKAGTYIKALLWLIVILGTLYIYFIMGEDVNSYYALCLVLDMAMYGMMVWPAMGCIYMDMEGNGEGKVGPDKADKEIDMKVEEITYQSRSRPNRGGHRTPSTAVPSTASTDSGLPMKFPKYNRSSVSSSKAPSRWGGSTVTSNLNNNKPNMRPNINYGEKNIDTSLSIIPVREEEESDLDTNIYTADKNNKNSHIMPPHPRAYVPESEELVSPITPTHTNYPLMVPTHPPPRKGSNLSNVSETSNKGFAYNPSERPSNVGTPYVPAQRKSSFHYDKSTELDYGEYIQSRGKPPHYAQDDPGEFTFKDSQGIKIPGANVAFRDNQGSRGHRPPSYLMSREPTPGSNWK